MNHTVFARYAAHVRANSFDFKGEIAIFSIDTPFALTEFFHFKASLLPSLRQITKRAVSTIDRPGQYFCYLLN